MIIKLISVLAAAVALAACTPPNTIDGHQVRGTAAPETPVEQSAREFNEQVGTIIAEAYGDDPQVQAKIRKLRAELAASENPGNLHAGAPQWFRDGWRRYLNDADGRYAVLAVDRNARGWGYVYCRGAGCHQLEGARNRSWKDVEYTNRALESCRENVREYSLAHRPECAIYAIKDKIVWEGPMPWE